MKQVNSSTRHLLHVSYVQGIDTRTKPDNYTVNSVNSTLKQRRRAPNRNQIVKVGLKKQDIQQLIVFQFMKGRTISFVIVTRDEPVFFLHTG